VKLSLKAARVNAKLTQVEAAEKIGCHRTSLSNWEIGKNMPDMGIGIKMAKVYGVKIDDLSFLESESTLSGLEAKYE
jgi:putative transcriptional regulator